MDCLGSAQIAGVCGISERFQYFYSRRVSRRCVEKSQITSGPPIATPPSWRSLMISISAVCCLHAPPSAEKRFLGGRSRSCFWQRSIWAKYNYDASRFVMISHSESDCQLLGPVFWTVPASFFLFAPPPPTNWYTRGHLRIICLEADLVAGNILPFATAPILLWARYMSPCMRIVCHYQTGSYNLRMTALISRKAQNVYLEVITPNRLQWLHLVPGILFTSFYNL